jgi:hypothetical protein
MQKILYRKFVFHYNNNGGIYMVLGAAFGQLSFNELIHSHLKLIGRKLSNMEVSG